MMTARSSLAILHYVCRASTPVLGYVYTPEPQTYLRTEVRACHLSCFRPPSNIVVQALSPFCCTFIVANRILFSCRSFAPDSTANSRLARISMKLFTKEIKSQEASSSAFARDFDIETQRCSVEDFLVKASEVKKHY